jgi:Mor family transcriptional regulator
MEGAGKKRKRVVSTVKVKVDMCNKLEHGENYNKLMKEYDIRSSTIYYI